MSTRCNLIVEDSYDHIQLRQHWDGYPGRAGGVLAALEQASLVRGPFHGLRNNR